MSIALYMDVQLPLAITEQLRLRKVEAITAQEDRAARMSDPDLLDRASALGRVLVTQDKDFLLKPVCGRGLGAPLWA
jgi:predicted nuclease of predicted toxin-antitoxin system